MPLSIQVRQREPMPLNTHAWLCPTHHAATHMLIAQQDRANEVGDDFKTTSTMTLVTIDLWSEREYSAVFEIAGACWLALHDYVDAPFGDYSLALLRDRLADVDQKERTLSLAIAERWPTNQWQGELDALLERCRESA